jgi:hypothetical protein
MMRRGYDVTAEWIVFPDGDELPRVGEPSRRILEPLTDRQLTACLRQAPLDRREDVCGGPPGPSLVALVRAAEMLAEWPDGTEEELCISHELLMWGMSKEVTECWSHVSKVNRRHHPGSKEDCLRSLVERIQHGRSTR